MCSIVTTDTQIVVNGTPSLCAELSVPTGNLPLVTTVQHSSTARSGSEQQSTGGLDPAPRADPGKEYGAKSILVLEGLEAVRKRPAMYIGSTDTRGLMHCLWEIFDNGVDEALAGFGRLITVALEADGSIVVTDQGRGIPVDTEPRTGLSGVEVVYTKLHAGGKFGGGAYKVAGGLHGVGASVVNALSSRLDVEVDRKSTTWGMSFRRGVPGRFDGDGPDAPFTPGSGLDKLRKAKRGATGTRVRYWPDRQIFLPEAQLSWRKLVDRARQTAFLVPGLEIRITDRRGVQISPDTGQPIEEVTETLRFEGGISEFADYLSSGQPVTEVLRLQGHDSFTETVPELDETGAMVPTDVERRLEVDIAVRWGEGYDTVEKSFVNIISTPKGGTHVQGFENGLLHAFNAGLEGTRLLKSSEEISKDDILEGLTAVVTVRLAEPQFEGQTKEVLGTPPVRRLVARIVESEMTEFLTSTKSTVKPVARALLEKVVNASRTRVAARAHRENQRRKNALESSHLPPKLKDCRSSDPDFTELFIVEGDSALGTANVARNSEHQALLPIRGKILNVRRPTWGRCCAMPSAPPSSRWSAPAPEVLRHRSGALRQGDLHGRRRFRRGAHPDPAGDPVLQVHAPDDRGRPGVLGGAAAAPVRAHQPEAGDGEIPVHLL
jgi:DNA gyrase subunit B